MGLSSTLPYPIRAARLHQVQLHARHAAAARDELAADCRGHQAAARDRHGRGRQPLRVLLRCVDPARAPERPALRESAPSA